MLLVLYLLVRLRFKIVVGQSPETVCVRLVPMLGRDLKGSKNETDRRWAKWVQSLSRGIYCMHVYINLRGTAKEKAYIPCRRLQIIEFSVNDLSDNYKYKAELVCIATPNVFL
mgnify:CR=1 FL=1